MPSARAMRLRVSVALFVSACLSSAAAAASLSYKTLISEVDINTVHGAIITACTILAVGGLMNLGIILAVAPMAAIPRAKDTINVEATVQVLPSKVGDEDRFDAQEDRIDALRPRRSLIAIAR